MRALISGRSVGPSEARYIARASHYRARSMSAAAAAAATAAAAAEVPLSVADAADAARALLPLLADAHAHPQLDVDHLEHTRALAVPCVAAMGVAANVDWGPVERLAALAGPEKVIPGFGIHPWWSHLHASAVGSTWEELLEGPSPEEVARAVEVLEERQRQQQQRPHEAPTAAGAADAYQAARGPQPGRGADATPGVCAGEPAAEASGRPNSSSTSAAPLSGSEADGGSGADGAGQACCGAAGSSSGGSFGGGGYGDPGGSGGAAAPGSSPLDIVPHTAWRTRLRALLDSHPRAVVGEIGIDRAAVIPGTRARVRLDHQLALLREQLALAAEAGRPVSVHCVRGYGHLLQLFAALPRGGGGGGGAAEACPPAVMLHSYGGSPEEVARFTRLPGIGPRFFFSFSAAINARTPEKLAARIRAVPDDRLLVESDQVTPLAIDAGMADICVIVAAAKGWDLETTARRTRDNFEAFFSSRGGGR